MSNLKLPALDFDSLDRLITDRAGNPAYISKTVAYATTVERCNFGLGDYFIVQHHESSIASVSRDEVMVTCAGWTSLTTLTRVSAVLADNRTGVYACRRDWVAQFGIWQDGKEELSEMDPSAWYRFNVGEANHLPARAASSY